MSRHQDSPMVRRWMRRRPGPRYAVRNEQGHIMGFVTRKGNAWVVTPFAGRWYRRVFRDQEAAGDYVEDQFTRQEQAWKRGLNRAERAFGLPVTP